MDTRTALGWKTELTSTEIKDAGTADTPVAAVVSQMKEAQCTVEKMANESMSLVKLCDGSGFDGPEYMQLGDAVRSMRRRNIAITVFIRTA